MDYKDFSLLFDSRSSLGSLLSLSRFCVFIILLHPPRDNYASFSITYLHFVLQFTYRIELEPREGKEEGKEFGEGITDNRGSRKHRPLYTSQLHSSLTIS